MTVSLTATGNTLADALQQLGQTGAVVPGSPPSPPSPAPVPTVDAFPVDPSKAPFPSPDDSAINILPDGTIVGPAYLRNKRGAFYTFKKDANGKAIVAQTFYGPGYAWFLNSQEADPTRAATRMLVRQGEIYLQVPGAGNVTYPTDDLFNANIRVGLPDASAPTPPGSPPPPPPPPASLPAGPAPSSVAPGSTGHVILAGPSQTITTLAAALAAAQPGDTIKLDAGAVFHESVLIDKPVLIDGQGIVANPGTATASFSGGAIIDGAGVTSYVRGLGGLVPTTDVIFKGLEVRGFGLGEPGSGGTAGIRAGGSGTFTIDNCYVHDCQDGAFSGGFVTSWAFKNSLFLNCGLGDGQSHNIYLSGGGSFSVTADNLTSIVPPTVADTSRATGFGGGGHAFKTRAPLLTIHGGYFASSDASPIDIPNGTMHPFTIDGATIHKSPADANHTMLGYGVEFQDYLGTPGYGGTVTNSVIDGLCANPQFNLTPGSAVTLTGCTFNGTHPIAQGGGTLVGA